MNQIYVVGIGPGKYEQMTIEAAQILEKVDVIVGYTVHVDLVKEHFPKKEFLTTPMRQEQDRYKLAFEEAMTGKVVALVCSGDAGVYGLSGLMLEIGRDYPECNVEVIAGVTAAVSGAAVLGAPLIHDFALISLSDLMTPWEKIEKRLHCAAVADFVMVLYNPSSKKRADYLQRACEIILSEQSEDTICAIVENIGREGERAKILPLKELKEEKVNMFTTVFIGNSQTRVVGNQMVTPRGYQL